MHVKFLAAALGAAMISAAVVVSSAPAHAEGCDQWGFNGTFGFVPDGGTVTYSVPAQGTHIDGRYSLNSSPGAPMRGEITGNTISLKIEALYINQSYLWIGHIDPAGNVTGTGEGLAPNVMWHSVGAPLVCKAAPPPEVTLRYDAPTLVGITGWVGMTNNAGKPAVDCTYSDGFLPPRPLSVYGDKETRIDLPGIPTGHVYNVVVNCGDLTHSEQKRF